MNPKQPRTLQTNRIPPDKTQPVEEEKYRYQPLNQLKQQVRLLRLAPGQFHQPIRGSLTVVSLDKLRRRKWRDQRGWFALSHVWGSDDRTEVVKICGKKAFVTKTLREALPYFRRTDVEQYLWIDQICIDQENLEERNSQVRLMRTLYSCASLVIAWLGIEDELFVETARLTYALLRAVRISLDGEPEALSVWRDDAMSEGMNVLRDLVIPDKPLDQSGHINIICQKLYGNLSALYRMPWFQRVWTLQEAVFADQLYLQAGVDIVDWDLLFLYRFIPEVENFDFFDIGNATAIHILRQQHKTGIEGTRLTSGICAMSRLERSCKDPRDFIYGQLGLLQPRVADDFRPNYSLPVEDVFMLGTKALIESDETLESLGTCCAECKRSKYELPSWCKDWSDWNLGCGIRDDGKHGFRLGLFETATALKPQCTISLQERFIRVGGVMIDEISKVCCGFNIDQEKNLREIWYAFKQKLAHPPNAPGSGVSSDSILRALINDTFDTVDRAPSSKISKAIKWLNDSEDSILFPVDLPEDYDFDADRVISHIRLIVDSSRSLFVTKDGLVGRSCKHVQPGDKVCILYGGRLPFILREIGSINVMTEEGERTVEDGYQFIGGECYVDSLVTNQSVDSAKQRGLHDNIFCVV